MRAWMCETLGQPLVLRDLPDPEVSAGQVVIDVHAAGVNFPDGLVIKGLYQLRPPLPFAPGGEVAGSIAQVGRGVEGLSSGDRVMAFIGFGGFADRALCVGSQIVKLPDNMSFEQGSGFLMTYCTGLHALVDRGRLRAGETLLVLGAAGGTGTAAIHLGKALGARVIAAASTQEKLEACKAEGADDGVLTSGGSDLKAQLKSMGGIDMVYDPVGGELSELTLRAMRPYGRFLVIGFASGTIPKLPLNLALLKEVDVVGVQWGGFAIREPDGQQKLLERLMEMVRSGSLRLPRIHRTYKMEDAPQALADIEARKVIGKAVILPRA